MNSGQINTITEIIIKGQQLLGTIQTHKEKHNEIEQQLKQKLDENEKTKIREQFSTYFEGKEGEGEGEGEGEREGEGEGEGEGEEKFETLGDLISMLFSGAGTGVSFSYKFGKFSFFDYIFNSIIMPILVVGGADEDSLITIESFLINPDITPEEIVEKLNTQHNNEKNALAKLGKSGSVLALTIKALGQTALRIANPQFDAIMIKLNIATGIIEKQIEDAQRLESTAGNMVDGAVTGAADKAIAAADKAKQDANKVAADKIVAANKAAADKAAEENKLLKK